MLCCCPLFSNVAMDKENRFKLGFARFFKSSYAACRSRIFSDATLAVGTPPSSDISSSLPAKSPTDSTSFPSICKPKSNQALKSDAEHRVKESSKRRGSRSSSSFKLTAHALFYSGEAPESPVSSMVLDREFYQNPRSRNRSKNSTSNRMSRSSSRRYSSSRRFRRVDFVFSSFSGDDDDDEHENDDVFLSSRSWSSESSKSQRMSPGFEMMMEESVAVVKRSRDPYEDFRTSMVEMIVEKQILSGKDMEKLLQSFLALNSRHHHRVILEVFMEIWEALFSDSS